jgi:DNA-binding SARP family transcriptional activator
MQVIENALKSEYVITMFGSFSIGHGSNKLEENSGRTQQVWNLLEYLIANRSGNTSAEKLIEFLWPSETSDNPGNALKNLAYRLRVILSGSFPDEKAPFIIYQRNSYSWNNTLNCEIDSEIIENCWNLANRETTGREEKKRLMLKITELYNGVFLPKSTREEWVTPLRTYYHQIYVQSVVRTAGMLIDDGDHAGAIHVCEKAASLDAYDERVHELLIRALAANGNHTAALDHYYYFTKKIYDDLGVKVSPGITRLYNEIAKSVNHVEADLTVIEEGLRAASQSDGALYCDYEVFKNIYCMQSRLIGRSGQSIFMVLLTVSDGKGAVPAPGQLSPAMDKLRAAAVETLRKSDVISRFSPTQYILMLSYLNHENCQMVLKRMLERFKKDCRLPSIRVLATQCPVIPIS